MKILVTGGTGLIGRALTKKLIDQGHKINILSRGKSKTSGVSVYKWNYESGYLEEGALKGVEAIFHLAGAGIAEKCWTEKRKKEIIESRVKTLQLLEKHIDKTTLKILIGGSAIGYYGGNTGENENTENTVAGKDFLAECTKIWEKSELEFVKKNNLKLVIVRIGVVLSLKGGALPKILIPINLNFGSGIGTGLQWISWIHMEDLIDILIKSLDSNHPLEIINGVAPKPERNNDFNKIAAYILNKTYFLPNVPSFVLRLILGEMSSVILGSSKVKYSGKHDFKFPTLELALRDLLKK